VNRYADWCCRYLDWDGVIVMWHCALCAEQNMIDIFLGTWLGE